MRGWVVTRILGLVLVVSLAGSGAAWAKAIVHPVSHARPHAIRVSTHVRQGRRRIPRVHLKATTASVFHEDGRARDASDLQADASNATGHAGWFKGNHEAGWGFDDGRVTTVAGLYQRPEKPDIPANQVYHTDSRGAAGLSLSFKLGQ